jgi:hypothetical protein
MPAKSPKKPTRKPLPKKAPSKLLKKPKLRVRCLGFGKEHYFYTQNPLTNRRCPECETKLHKYHLSKWECGPLEFPCGGERPIKDF